MNPSKVKEILNGLIEELKLPIRISESGPKVIINSDSATRERAEEIVKEWMDGDHLSHCISVGRTVAEIYKLTTRLALDTHRSPEVKSILESLIAERKLPLEVTDCGFRLEILIDDGVDYRSEEMMTLESMYEKEGLDIPVRHNGFHLYHKEDVTEVQFADAETVAKHLASLLIEHGLHVKLLHIGFQVHKKQEDKIDIAEVEELTNRLEAMVGIHYVQGGYGYIVPGLDTEIHWTQADITTALP